MSNSRYTLQVETNDDNLMFFWRTHLNHNLPFDVNFRAGEGASRGRSSCGCSGAPAAAVGVWKVLI